MRRIKNVSAQDKGCGVKSLVRWCLLSPFRALAGVAVWRFGRSKWSLTPIAILMKYNHQKVSGRKTTIAWQLQHIK